VADTGGTRENGVTFLKESEADWQRTEIQLLQTYGYRVCEFRKARIKKDGVDVYRTPFGAQGNGMVDIIAARPSSGNRPGRVLFIENKSEEGTLSPDQELWRAVLELCPGVEYWLARPSDYDKFVVLWE
jgi:hypothetical protein